MVFRTSDSCSLSWVHSKRGQVPTILPSHSWSACGRQNPRGVMLPPWFHQTLPTRKAFKSHHSKKNHGVNPINWWPIWKAETIESKGYTEIFSNQDGYCVLRISVSAKACLFSWYWSSESVLILPTELCKIHGSMGPFTSQLCLDSGPRSGHDASGFVFLV